MKRLISFVLILQIQVGSFEFDTCYPHQSSQLASSYDDLVDYSWIEYLKEIYNLNISRNCSPDSLCNYQIDKQFDHLNKLNLIYKRAKVELILDESAKKFVLSSFHDFMLPFITFIPDHPYTDFHPDNSWIEVIRFDNEFIGLFNPHGSWKEGLGAGYPPGNTQVTPYGCWFYTMRGSGIYINIGKTLIASSRKEVEKILGISDDRYWCEKATALGYETVQMVNEFSGRTALPEIVVCSSACTTTEFTSSCPPNTPLRTGVGDMMSQSDVDGPKGQSDCPCSNALPLLNCGSSRFHLTVITPWSRIEYLPFPSDRRKTCHMVTMDIPPVQNKHFTIIFTTNLLQSDHHVKTLHKLMERNLDGELGRVLVINRDIRLRRGGGGELNEDMLQIMDMLLDSNQNQLLMIESFHDGSISVDPSPQELRPHSPSTLSVSFPYPMEIVVKRILFPDQLRIGIILINHLDSSYFLHDEEVHHFLHRLLDESLCLRKTSHLVLLLADFIELRFSKLIYKYFDAILVKQLEVTTPDNDHPLCQSLHNYRTYSLQEERHPVGTKSKDNRMIIMHGKQLELLNSTALERQMIYKVHLHG